MIRAFAGILLALHGLVHLWYVALSSNLIEFKPEMGWTSDSWLLTGLLGSPATRALATILFTAAAIGFLAAGTGLLMRSPWWQPVALVTAGFSTLLMLLLWDGHTTLLVQKGLVGLVINAAIITILSSR
ncbi:hypothetical protein KY327_00125 [Candidatus Woesearchaeota archaeon]|nr:hypothetical protein [Candidatus Woesearchaeota archaeon]